MSEYQEELEHLEKLKGDVLEARRTMGITHDGWFYWSLKKDYDEAKQRLIDKIQKE